MKSKVTRYRVACARQLRGLVLDLGAGEGDYAPHLPAGAVHLDVDLDHLRLLPGRKVAASAVHLPFPEDTFDGVWSCAVLEHVEINFIPEAARVTRPGGVLYILTPNRDSPWDPLKRLAGLGDWWSNEGHVRLYSARELRRFGKVWGEVWWAPGLDRLTRLLPRLGHTLMLRVDVTPELKARLGVA